MAKDKLTFETAFARIEALVAELESGDLSLDDLLERYSEALKMLTFCRKALAEAEKKMEILTKDEKGRLQLKPAAIEPDEEKES